MICIYPFTFRKMTEPTLQEVTATRGVAGDQFDRGLQEFNFSIGAPNAVIMSKSYFRIELELKGDGGLAPTMKEQLAFSDDTAGGLYNNCYFRGGGQNISSVNQFAPWGSAIKKRLGSSKPWFDTLGKVWGSEADLTKRIQNVSSDTAVSPVSANSETFRSVDTSDPAKYISATVSIDASIGEVEGVDTKFDTAGEMQVKIGDILTVSGVGYTVLAVTDNNTLTVAGVIKNVAAINDWYITRRNVSRTSEGKNKVYVLWQPPIGIFSHDEPLAAGDWSIQLNPSSRYNTSIIETLNPFYKGKYAVTVSDVKLYIHTEKMSLPDQVYNLDLMECGIQSKVYSNNLQFSVPASTKSLAIFVQDVSAGSNPAFPPSMFKAKKLNGGTGGDLTLQTLQVTYAGVTRTATPWQSDFNDVAVGGVNLNILQQRYNDTYKATGRDLADSGCESFDDWLKRGALMYFDWERDYENRSTEVQIQSNYRDLHANTNMFVVAFYSKGVDITTSSGVITSVQSRQI